MNIKNTLILFLIIVLYPGDQESSILKKTNKLVSFIKDNPISSSDVFLETQGSFTGAWHPTILFFGSANNSYNCNEIVEFYKTVEPSMIFRCSATMDYKYKLGK